ncbi:MAG: hypothetical protein Q7U28_05415 [Aquabacterium sp.]|nr:hypothetical protein [Aquabacterium sp.]
MRLLPLITLLTLLTLMTWGQAHAGVLPQRNLTVEWRVSGHRVSTAVGPRSVGTLDTDEQRDTVQQVQVLNGGRAKLFVGHTQSYTVWQWAWTGGAAGAAQAVPQTTTVELGQGLTIRPRWAGGHAPVVVELEAQSRQPQITQSTEPDGQTRRMEVGSTLSVPIGQWAVVARSGVRVQRQQGAGLSTRDLDDNQQEQLEIRISAP